MVCQDFVEMSSQYLALVLVEQLFAVLIDAYVLLLEANWAAHMFLNLQPIGPTVCRTKDVEHIAIS